MTNVIANELLAIIGGAQCQGVWIGTYDGKYGVCIGHWDP